MELRSSELLYAIAMSRRLCLTLHPNLTIELLVKMVHSDCGKCAYVANSVV